jgi:phosphopantothenoylcysteine decarboxylase/phosphopantothenate--cysteine ligase
MAAAVADFRPQRAAAAKIKRREGPPTLELEPTPDILLEVVDARRPGVVVVGFAAETDDVEAAGRAKLASKGVDLLIANQVGRPGTGFGSDTDDAAVIDAAGDDVPLRRWTKRELANEILDRAVGRLG